MLESPPPDFNEYPETVRTFCAQRWVTARHADGQWFIQQRTHEVNGIVKTDSIVTAGALKAGDAMSLIVATHTAAVAKSIEALDAKASATASSPVREI